MAGFSESVLGRATDWQQRLQTREELGYYEEREIRLGRMRADNSQRLASGTPEHSEAKLLLLALPPVLIPRSKS